ncbi:MAG: methionine synthase [Candidatus Rokuibacteriota bacterium]|nr:MAG: methionine synthase [Candidatus Rokubacteria bacterium]
MPILPTTVVGSYAIPAWLWAAYEKIEAGGFGRMDVAETENDAVATAVRDQERAGVDVISDGEMRRQGFIVSIFKYFHGLKPIEPRRKVGVLSYDGHVLYEPVERISAPDGLGTVRELQYLRQVTARPFKITLPGPLTLATQITKGGPYRDRVEVATDLAPIINRELRALAAGGAENLQIDDVYQSFMMEPKRLVELYDRCFEGVAVTRRFWHICFGTLEGFGFGERTYRPLFPMISSASADQLVFEFANREMAETGLWREFDCPKELGAGVLDLKNFYVESPELVARRIRRMLESVPAERLWINPDCGLARLPRHLAFAKLQALVIGTRQVRQELTGRAEPARTTGERA